MPAVVLSNEFVPVIEDQLYREPGADYVMDQFVMELDSFESKPGDTVRVNGPTFITPSSAPTTDRKLTSVADRVSDNPAQTIGENFQEVQLDEYLLPNPLQIQEYDAAHSAHDLAQMNGGALAEDYFAWRDAMILKRMTDSTFVRYVGGVANEAALTTASKISADEIVISAALLSQRFIPRFPDGNYICIIDDATLATFYTEQKFLDASVRALASNAPVFRGEMVVYGGVRFIKSNNMAAVTIDSDGANAEGSQALLFGTSTYGMYPMGFADQLISQGRMDFFRGKGAGPVARVRGQAVSVRMNSNDDFGRFQEMIWLEHSAYSVIDPGVVVYDGTKTKGTDTRFIQKLIGANVLSA